MTIKELVHTVISGTIICLVVMIIGYGIISCSRREAKSPYITTITVTSQREFGVNRDFKTITNIEIDSEYSFKDYQMDYDNDRIIINLKKENGSPGSGGK